MILQADALSMGNNANGRQANALDITVLLLFRHPTDTEGESVDIDFQNRKYIVYDIAYDIVYDLR